MRYFTDEQLSEMKMRAKTDYDPKDSTVYLAYITKLEMLDRRNDEYGDCRTELLKAISDMEKVTERYVHRGKADPDDEDNDAFEYENYTF